MGWGFCFVLKKTQQIGLVILPRTRPGKLTANINLKFCAGGDRKQTKEKKNAKYHYGLPR